MARIAAFDYDTKVTVSLYVSDCARCGVVFGISKELEARRRSDAGTFYCPNGHSLGFGQSEADRLKGELEAERQRLKWARDDAESLRGSLAETQKSLSATKGVVTRMKKRAKAGLCPYCNRHFTPLERHVETMHSAEAAST